MLNARYDGVTLVQVGLSAEGARSGDWGPTYSSDTGMNEVMLVARKRASRRTEADAEADPPRVKLVLLKGMPQSRLEASETARAIKSARPVRLEAGMGHTSIMVGGVTVGKAVDCPVENGRWWVGRVSDVYLLHTVYAMSHDGLGTVQMTTLGALARMGKLGRDITGSETNKHGVPRGPFRKVPRGKRDRYPCLWNNRVTEQTAMLVPHDWALEPRRGSTRRAADAWATASRLHVNLQVDYRSQRLIAAYTRKPTLGGTAWPNVTVDAKYEKALAVWCNSSLGVLAYLVTSSGQQRGRGRMSKTAFKEFPVPDFRTVSGDVIAELDALFDRRCTRKMLPVNRMEADGARIILDERMAAILGITRDLDDVRRRLSRERQFGRRDPPADGVMGGA